MQSFMDLDSWDRFTIVCIGSLVVVIAVAIVACFVGPGCWGYEYLLQKRKRKKQSFGEKITSQQDKTFTLHTCEFGNNFWLDNHEYVAYETGKFGILETFPRLNDTIIHSKENVFNMKCAPLLVSPNLNSTVENSVPKLKVKLSYSEIQDFNNLARLCVDVISAASLPCREYTPSIDPYVSIDVLNNKWSLQKYDRLIQNVQTRVLKGNRNPCFYQSFAFDGTKRDIRNWCLKFTIVDSDRLAGVMPLFEKRIYIKELKNLILDGSVCLNLDMQAAARRIGTLLFGIRYLPTAKRFHINIFKASKLKYQHVVPTLSDFHPFIRILMLNSQGKCIKKKKTCFKQGDTSPVFNQSFIFDLSVINLEHIVFLMLLCTKNMAMESDESSCDGDIDKSHKKNKDKVLGTIVLGRNVKCTRARNHWVAIMQNPRKMVSMWHELR